MCGIAGIVDSGCSDAALARAAVQAMSDAVAHRGPDSSGVWVDPSAGIALGHRRLAILDLSDEGRQPMTSASGRYVVTYNGEIYNYRELRAELISAPVPPPFRGSSDTEVMLAAFDRWGLDESVRRFNGMFAFALWDRRERLLHLVRDRLGEKPLYYARLGKSFLFASELKALRAHPRFDAEIDRDVLACFLRYAYIPAPYSIYRGVFKLPAGAVMTLNPDRPEDNPSIRSYWSAERAAREGCSNPFDGSPEQALPLLENLLSDAVGMRMVSDVPLGAFLSGGVDSSTVVALMQRNSRLPVRTFTIGFEERGYDEARRAKAVAQHLGTSHTELYVTPDDALAVIPRLPGIYDEPFADSSQIPTFLISRLARGQVTVSLSGDGGDEVFGGYNRYNWGAGVWRTMGWIPGPARSALARLVRVPPPHLWDAFVARLPRRFQQPQAGDKLHKLASVLAAGDMRGLYLGFVAKWGDSYSAVPDASRLGTELDSGEAWAAVSDFTHKMMLTDTVTYLPDDILVKLDRAAMAVGLETRVPLLDHRVVEFAWRLPASMKVRGGQGKWILRELLRKYLPENLTDRPKSGFAVPLHRWLRGPLREWAEELLGEDRLRREGYLDPRPIRRKWSQHLARTHNWVDPLWSVLMFQAWLEAQHSRVDQPFLTAV